MMLVADPELAIGHRLLEAAARRRGFLQSGGRIDTARFAVIFLDELRGGRIGRISLEWPPEQTGRARTSGRQADRDSSSGAGGERRGADAQTIDEEF